MNNICRATKNQWTILYRFYSDLFFFGFLFKCSSHFVACMLYINRTTVLLEMWFFHFLAFVVHLSFSTFSCSYSLLTLSVPDIFHKHTFAWSGLPFTIVASWFFVCMSWFLFPHAFQYWKGYSSFKWVVKGTKNLKHQVIGIAKKYDSQRLMKEINKRLLWRWAQLKTWEKTVFTSDYGIERTNRIANHHNNMETGKGMPNIITHNAQKHRIGREVE